MPTKTPFEEPKEVAEVVEEKPIPPRETTPPKEVEASKVELEFPDESREESKIVEEVNEGQLSQRSSSSSQV
jgi:predicted ATPase